MTGAAGRSALVLGAGGFLGSHLARHLLLSGWDVTGVVRDRSDAHAARRLDGLLDEIRLVEGDAADPGLLARLVRRTDVVFPFAGRSGASVSMTDPAGDLEANGAGQLAVLEALRANNPDARVVFPGSRLQYGRCESVPVAETHTQRPLSVYGVHKKLGEEYHRLYWDVYAVPTTVLRISNPYGPHQDRPDGRFGIVGTFLARAASGKDITVFGGGTQLRDFVYVSDVTRLCELAATHPAAPGEVFNASGPAAVSLREMAETVVDVVGDGAVVSQEWPVAEAAVETGDYAGDITKAWRLLGWRPEVDLREGLSMTWRSVRPGQAVPTTAR